MADSVFDQVKPGQAMAEAGPSFDPLEVVKPESQALPAEKNESADARIQRELDEILKQDIRYAYKGKVGDNEVSLYLFSDPRANLTSREHFTGVCFENKNWQDARIEGESDGKRNIVLNEYDQKGNKVGEFAGAFAETDPQKHFTGSLTREVVAGNFVPVKGDKKPFYLQETEARWLAPKDNEYKIAGVPDPINFEKKVQDFRNAVLTGDREAVASMVSYPIPAFVRKGWQTMQNREQFLRNYNRIFHPQFVSDIERSVPHHMYAKYEGVALGENGSAWFNARGQVFSIRNELEKK